jgi:hypothetical protein
MTDFQENLKKIYDANSADQLFAQFNDSEALKTTQAAVQAYNNLASSLIAANVGAASDAIILQSLQTRNGVEDFLKQVGVLAGSKDLQSAIESQKAYLTEVTETLREASSKNVELLAAALETNINLINQAVAKPVKKPAAKKAAVVKAAPKKATTKAA